jgi:transposase InsO family protein
LRTGKQNRVLNVIDEYTRRSVGCVVEFNITAKRVQDELARLFRAHGIPDMIRTDNGREFIAVVLADWLREKGVEPKAVEKASPQQNGYIESFHSLMDRDLLAWEHFDTLLEARTIIQRWCKKDYNAEHRHGSLYNLTPNRFAHTYWLAKQRGHAPPPVKLAGDRNRKLGATTPVEGSR